MQIKKLLIKLVLWLILFALISAIAYGSFFLHKLNTFSNKINIYQKSENLFDTITSVAQITKNNSSELKNTDGERINVLLLGVAGRGKPGQNLTDTIMIANINLKISRLTFRILNSASYVAKIFCINCWNKT